ncbi:CD9 antigen isoform X2 [Enoplosus armatus]|uniref:CD9 antigen isoform X2 n=1 Tax=Enoplosus armatus TaxID=215367 RepID=UPI00399232A7
MQLDGCGRACKYILFVFNLIFAVLGFAFLGLGMWLRLNNSTRDIFRVEALNSSAFVMAVTVLIALGSVMLIVVLFGDYGACSEKRLSLHVFSALVAVLAVAEVVVGVLAYSRRSQVENGIAEFYITMYTLYLASGDPVIGFILTIIHKMLHCCGVTGLVQFEFVKKTCPEPDGFFQKFKMPNCPEIMVNFFDSKESLVIGVFVGTGILLITALVCSIILLKQIKKGQQEITTHYATVY